VKGIRVALIGDIMDDLAALTTPDRMGPWRALPAAETVRKYCAEVRGRADLVVVLAHTGDPAVLDALPGAGVVIAGHVHGALESAREKDGRVLVRSDSYGRELGRLDLQLDLAAGRIASWNWKHIRIDSRALPAAGDVAARVAKWDKRVAKIVDVRIGAATQEIAGPALRALIEDAMREATGADLACMNPGGIRDRLRPGNLLARHVWNLMPFDNTVVVGKFRGDQLPQTVTQGRQIEAGRQYTLAINDFMAANQKTELKATGLVFNDTGKLLRDVIIQYIRKRGTVP